MSLQLKPVQSPEEIRIAAALADEIWHQHYGALLGTEQVDYMVEKFQSEGAISKQIVEGVTYVLAVDNGEPVGFCAYHPEQERMFLSKIYLQKAMRGKGIARQFLNLVEREAAKMGLSAVYLTVNKENSGSIAAYKAMGFQTVDAVKTPIGNGYFMDDYIMQKEL